MKENKYDEEIFFEKYSCMDRSRQGLQAAGEWSELQKLLPDFTGKRVLDLGCGYGWHCRYAAEQGAAWVLGTDISHKMLREAHTRNQLPNVEYRCAAMEDLDFAPASFDVVISSLAFHYVRDFGPLIQKVAHWLKPGGELVFSTEHPVFTAYGTQDWYYAPDGSILHFPVDRYFEEGGPPGSLFGGAGDQIPQEPDHLPGNTAAKWLFAAACSRAPAAGIHAGSARHAGGMAPPHDAVGLGTEK